MRTIASLLLLAAAACTPGDGVQFQVINMERPGDGLGMLPPADYRPCYVGQARAYDTNGDGKVDAVRVSVDGKDRCYGEDTNRDGKIDRWDVTDERGNLAKRTQDTNFDGRADQAWTFDPTTGAATSQGIPLPGVLPIPPAPPPAASH